MTSRGLRQPLLALTQRFGAPARAANPRLDVHLRSSVPVVVGTDWQGEAPRFILRPANWAAARCGALSTGMRTKGGYVARERENVRERRCVGHCGFNGDCWGGGGPCRADGAFLRGRGRVDLVACRGACVSLTDHGELSRARRAEIRALHRKRERLKRRRLLVEGPRALEPFVRVLSPNVRDRRGQARACIRYAVADADAVQRDDAVREMLARLKEAAVAVYRVTAQEFAELATTQTPQGILAVLDETVPPPLAEWLRHDADETVPPGAERPRNRCRLLILEAVQDPGNVGTLLRSAGALGAGGVVLTQGTAEPTNPKVVRASAGALATLPVWHGLETKEVAAAVEHADLTPLLARIGAPSYRRLELPARAALLLGAEVAGLSETWQQASPRAVALGIPQAPEPQSLNVAMAGTILLAHLATDT